MTASSRVDLWVPFSEKAQAKALGALFDPDREVWYVPPGVDLDKLSHWLPPSDTEADAVRGVSLFQFLSRVKEAVRDGVSGPEWVRVEIRELRSKDANYYLWVEERNDAGDVLAKCEAKIWKNVSARVNAKFRDATGDQLRHDIKVLFLVRARFEPLFGFTLSVEDVDPSYTLGDLAAKLNKIRETLQREGVFESNRSLSPPIDYCRVAVISPDTSAGLGTSARRPTVLKGPASATSISTRRRFKVSTRRRRSGRRSGRSTRPIKLIRMMPWRSSGAGAP